MGEIWIELSIVVHGRVYGVREELRPAEVTLQAIGLAGRLKEIVETRERGTVIDIEALLRSILGR